MIDEECGYILDLGVDFRPGQRIDSLKALLARGLGRDLRRLAARRAVATSTFPGRSEAAQNIHIGIDWLSSVSFGHITKIGRRVIVLGGGNTAMDCCRSSRRLGGEEVKVVVRSGFEEMKASPWEKEDAMHEGIPILNFLVPKAFTHDNGRLTGMTFEKVTAEYDAKGRRNLVPSGEPDEHHPLRRRAGRGRPGECVSLDRARHRHRVRQMGHAQGRPQDHAVDAIRRCSSAAMRRSGRRTSSGRSPTAMRPRFDRHDALGEDIAGPPAAGVEVVSQKMGIHEWSYDNEISPDRRFRVPLRDKVIALDDIKAEVELGFDYGLALKEAERCLNCDVQTVFTASLCIECDACVDICPMDCITFTQNGEEAELRHHLKAPANNLNQDIYVADGLKTGRIMAKDEDVCLHCGLCAERCPTGAWDMKKYLIDMTHAGTRHASTKPDRPRKRFRRPLRQRQRLGLGECQRTVRPRGAAHGRAGVVAQHLPRRTFRACRPGTRSGSARPAISARRGGIDLMVAMNPQTWDKDVAGIEPGGYLFYDSTKPMPASKFRDDIIVLGVPLTAICNREYTDPRQRQLFKNIIYLGALVGAARHRARSDRDAVPRAVQGQGKTDRRQPARAASRPRLGHHGAPGQSGCGLKSRRADTVGDRIYIDGNSAAALGAVYGGATVARGIRSRRPRRWPTLLRATARSCAPIRRPASNKYAIIQAEDEIASIGIVVGAGWNGARAFTATRGPASR